MNSAFWSLLAFVPFFLLLVLHACRKRSCPECGAALAGFQSPWTKTRRQWLLGGYLCRQCGCESDASGQRVVPGSESDRRTLYLSVALLVLAVIPAIALTALVLY